MTHLLYRILYSSQSAITGCESSVKTEVDSILARSAARNAAAGITGALLMTADHFIQVLEGPLGALELTFERICCDLRHVNVSLIELTPIDARVFPEWSMTSVDAGDEVRKLFPVLVMDESDSHRPKISAASDALIQLMRTLLDTQIVMPARRAG